MKNIVVVTEGARLLGAVIMFWGVNPIADMFMVISYFT